MKEPEKKLLQIGLRKLGVDSNTELLRMLCQFINLLHDANQIYRFVEADREKLVTRHVLDSLAAVPVLYKIHPRATLLDVGTGAGFPGIPIALALPQIRVTLVERNLRRVTFLRSVQRALGLKLLTIVNGSVKDVELPQFDIVTCRAVAPLSRLLPDLKSVLYRGSTLALYQGTMATVQRELETSRNFGSVRIQSQVVPLKVPFVNAERHLVLLRGWV